MPLFGKKICSFAPAPFAFSLQELTRYAHSFVLITRRFVTQKGGRGHEWCYASLIMGAHAYSRISYVQPWLEKCLIVANICINRQNSLVGFHSAFSLCGQTLLPRRGRGEM